MSASSLCVLALALHAANAADPRHYADASGDLPAEAITAVAVDPDDERTLYAGMDGFLFKSTDDGERWRPILSFPRGTGVDEDGNPVDAADEGIDLSPGDVPGATADALTRAVADAAAELTEEAAENPDSIVDDEAAASEELPDGDLDPDELDTVAFARAGPGVRAIVFVPGSSTVFYVATPRGLYRTTTKGGSFERIPIAFGAEGDDVRDIAIDPARPSRLFVATASGLMKSGDGGAVWRRVGGTVGSAQVLAVTISADGTVLLAGTEEGLFRSTDAGDTFLDVLLRALPPRFGVAAVAVSPVSGTLYAGTSQGLWVGERGAALLERYEGIPATLVQALLPDTALPRAVAVGTRSRGVLMSNDAGITVDEKAPQVPANEVFAVARGKKKDAIAVATDRGLFRSVSGTGITVTQSGLKKLREQWAKEPSLADAAQRALAYNHLDPEILSSMRFRAGIAKLMPELRASYWIVNGQSTTRDEFLFRGGDELPPGVDPNNDNTDLFGNVGAFVLQPAEGVNHVFVVTLQWDLDKLILNESEIAVSRRTPQTYAAEKRVVDRVQRGWVERRRLMTEIAFGPAGRGAAGAKIDVERQLKLDEITAQLDGATGGAFSQSQSP